MRRGCLVCFKEHSRHNTHPSVSGFYMTVHIPEGPKAGGLKGSGYAVNEIRSPHNGFLIKIEGRSLHNNNNMKHTQSPPKKKSMLFPHETTYTLRGISNIQGGGVIDILQVLNPKPCISL